MITSESLNAEYVKLLALILEKPSEKLTVKLEKLKIRALRLLKRTMKSGANIVGRLEHELIAADPDLKQLRSRWARKRGRRFETQLRQLFSEYFSVNELPGVAYVNQVSKFGFQPYDLGVFSQLCRPIFFECKSSGAAVKTVNPRLLACRRRYANYAKHNVRINEFFRLAGSPLFFAFNLELEQKILFVNAQVISTNLDLLNTRFYQLNSDYVLLDRCVKTWPLDLLQLLHSFTKKDESRA